MTIEERLNTALSAILPTYCGNFVGSDPSYISYRVSRHPARFYNNRAHGDRCAVFVDLFCELGTDSREYRRKLRDSLESDGFARPDEEDVSDKYGQHFSYSCEVIG